MPVRYGSGFRQHDVVDNDLGPRLERWDEIPQDLCTVSICPVVKNPAEEVDIRTLDRLLLGEEVVGHERNPRAQLGGHVVLSSCDYGTEVLDNDRKGGKLPGDCKSNMSMGPSDLWQTRIKCWFLRYSCDRVQLTSTTVPGSKSPQGKPSVTCLNSKPVSLVNAFIALPNRRALSGTVDKNSYIDLLV